MKFNKVISLGLVAVMTVATLAGCGTKQASSGDASDTFLIGGLGPLTGEAASYGTSVKQGAEIAVEEINKAGGVTVGDKKVKLELKFEDDQAKPDVAITAYSTLMDAGMDALLGCVTSGACLAVIDHSSQDGILQVTPSGSAAGCTEYDNTFRLCFTDPLRGTTMADFAIDTLAKKNIAVIYNNGDEYSKGMKDAFEAEVAAKGGTIVASEAFATGDVDFSTQLTKIKATNAEIIFVPAYYQDAAYITKQAKDLGMSLPFIGGDGWDGVLGAVTDPSAVEGAIFLSPFLATDSNEAVQTFVKTYNEKYNATPDQFAADGYDTVYVMKAAMEKAASTKSADMIKAMTEIEVKGLTGDVTFTAEGEPNKGAKFVEIKDGKYTARQ